MALLYCRLVMVTFTHSRGEELSRMACMQSEALLPKESWMGVMIPAWEEQMLLTLSFLSGGASNSYSDAGSCTAYTVYFAAAIFPTLVSNLLLAVEEVERKLILHLQGGNPVV